MPHRTKIATCCYCGMRAALVLRGRERHELACASCGAPLHDLKMLRADAVETRPAAPRRPTPSAAKKARKRPAQRPCKKSETYREKPRKRRKSTARWLLEEAFDALEDIFD